MENDLFEKEPYSNAVESNSIKVTSIVPLIDSKDCTHPIEKRLTWTGMENFICSSCGIMMEDYVYYGD